MTGGNTGSQARNRSNDSSGSGRRTGKPGSRPADSQERSSPGGHPSEHQDMSDERGEHHYPDANATESERRSRREREDFKRRLEHGEQSDLRRDIKRNKP